MVLTVLAVIIGVLLYALVRLGRDDYQLLANKMAARSRKSFGLVRPCPLCGTLLERGQRVRTKVITVGSGNGRARFEITESIVHMYGCPFCDQRDPEAPVPSKIVPGPGLRAGGRPKRVCPVCAQELGSADYVIARMFEREGRKSHLHVLGCTRCRQEAFRAKRG